MALATVLVKRGHYRERVISFRRKGQQGASQKGPIWSGQVNKLMKKAKSLETIGETLTAKETYEEAAKVLETQAAMKSNARDAQLARKLSLCYQKVDEVMGASIFAERAFQLNPTRFEDGLRLLSCLGREGRLDDMAQLASDIRNLENLPEDVEEKLTQALSKAEDMVKEAQQGNFPVCQMYFSAAQNSPLQVGEFVGPVEVRKIPGKGNGLVCTKDCPQGSLLVAERALASVRKDKEDIDATKQKLAEQMARKAQWSKDYLQQVCELYAGPEHDGAAPAIDVSRFVGIANLNSIGGTILQDNLSHVFRLTSRVNHACQPNVSVQTVGDFALVRTIRHVPANDELVADYLPETFCPTARARQLLATWEFKCHCQVCQAFDANPEAFDSRSAVEGEIGRIMQDRDDVERLTELLSLADRIEGDKADGRMNKVVAFILLVAVSVAGRAQLYKPEVQEVQRRAYRALDASGSEFSMVLAAHLWRAKLRWGGQGADEVVQDVEKLGEKYFGDPSCGMDEEFVKLVETGEVATHVGDDE